MQTTRLSSVLGLCEYNRIWTGHFLDFLSYPSSLQFDRSVCNQRTGLQIVTADSFVSRQLHLISLRVIIRLQSSSFLHSAQSYILDSHCGGIAQHHEKDVSLSMPIYLSLIHI